MNKTKITFAFVGRLTKEKGFDFICNRLVSLDLTNNPLLHKFTLDIYGDGPLRNKAQEVSELLPNTNYHGQLPFKKILEDISYFDYNLMPSVFLETFGLTAIDFAFYEIPTIGFAKGGLKELIVDPILDIYTYEGESDYDKFVSCIEYILCNIDVGRYNYLKNKTLSMYKSYSKEKWLADFDGIINSIDK